ncbi:MAG: twin-arginine translocation signal domain-containing protein [Sulfurifustaceae bacterium]
MIAEEGHVAYTRRRFLGAAALGTLALGFGPGFAAELLRTPAQTEGPFYPDKLPLDTDNDLLIVNDRLTPAVGHVTHLTGSIRDVHGEPINNAVIEIWQVDHNGVYLHSGSDNGARRDRNFQGFGRFLTASSGEYYFRTIKPVPYPGRAPHIHVAVKVRGHEAFTTQCYVKGEPLNERDGVLNGIADPRARAAVVVPFTPIRGSRANELAARFDIVLGFTPAA